MNESELWRDVVGHEGWYQVSNLGNVRSVRRQDYSRSFIRYVGGRPMTPSNDKFGYLSANLRCYDNKPKRRKIHQLVLEAFVGPRPKGMVACHNDGNKHNNRLDNLRWDSQSANLRDAVRHGTHPESSKTHCSNGHEYSPDNTSIRSNNKRRCLTCHRIRESARYHAKKKVA